MSIDLFNPDREELLKKWRDMIHVAAPISQWTTDAEIAWLAEAASTRHLVAEVGSYKGKSAKAMTWRRPPVSVLYCVDRFQDETEDDFRWNLANELEAQLVELLPVESEEGARFLRDSDIMLDMVFIDASHTKEDVLRDLQLWTPLVKMNGLVCGHDAYPHDKENGIVAALQEYGTPYKIVLDSIWAFRR